jgi:hypothetical protein
LVASSASLEACKFCSSLPMSKCWAAITDKRVPLRRQVWGTDYPEYVYWFKGKAKNRDHRTNFKNHDTRILLLQLLHSSLFYRLINSHVNVQRRLLKFDASHFYTKRGRFRPSCGPCSLATMRAANSKFKQWTE